MVGVLAVVILTVEAQTLPPPQPTNAAWVSVLPTALGLVYNSAQVAVGSDFALTPQVGVVVEAAFHAGGPYIYDCANQAFGLWVSAGLAWRPLAKVFKRYGLFIEPKLVLHFADPRGLANTEAMSEYCPSMPYPSGTDLDAGLGASVGWDWVVFDRLYLGSALGASIGLGRTRAPTLRVLRTDAFDFIVHYDLSLLRIGFAW